LLRGKLWKPVIAPCHIYYPLWKDLSAQSRKTCCRRSDLLRVGPVVRSGSESISLAGEGLGEGALLR
jgi:hypothetical protein